MKEKLFELTNFWPMNIYVSINPSYKKTTVISTAFTIQIASVTGSAFNFGEAELYEMLEKELKNKQQYTIKYDSDENGESWNYSIQFTEIDLNTFRNILKQWSPEQSLMLSCYSYAKNVSNQEELYAELQSLVNFINPTTIKKFKDLYN